MKNVMLMTNEEINYESIGLSVINYVYISSIQRVINYLFQILRILLTSFASIIKMKTALALMILSVVGWTQSAAVFDPSLDTHWQNFKNAFQKSYTDIEERTRRLVWEKNVAEIIRHNLEHDLGLHSFRKGLNEYADMEHHEFARKMNGYRRSMKVVNDSSTFIPPSNLILPASVDWRKEGLVTGVKNQGQCGSCWAFSTTGSLEGQHKKKTGKLVSLSEQNLVDCSGPEGNFGCEGGLMDQGFQYIKKNGGIDTEQAYPYTAEDGTCHYKPSASGATCTGYVDIPSGDEAALQKAVATVGPISVAIDASQFSFQLYSGGIYDEPSCSSEQLDHGVLAVGYGTENGQDYWLVKNSWGVSWGEQGYIKMSRNKNNQCGIATQASYPLV